MSLTSHLELKNSPVREFILGCAPELAQSGGRSRAEKERASAFGFDEVLASELLVPVPSEVENRRIHAPFVGTAFDYRARVMLGPLDPTTTTAAKGMLGLLSLSMQFPEFERRRSVLLDGFRQATELMAVGTPAEIDRACAVFAWCESIHRAGTRAFDGSLGQLLDSIPVGDLLDAVPEPVLADVAELRTANTSQIELWRQDIDDGTPYEPNPKFEGSVLVDGADADWIIGDALVECKVTETLSSSWIRNTLFQLIGYALLDLADDLHIRNVAIWLPRHCLLKTWSLAELLEGDVETRLSALRHRFVASRERVCAT